MELRDWLTILIPAGVTIIGLIVNYIATKNSIKQEVSKQKSSIKVEKLFSCLEDYQNANRAIWDSSKLPDKEKENIINEQVKAFKGVMDNVFFYGSEEACKIASAWQQYNYTLSDNHESSMVPVCYANLLSSQICLDATGSCNRPSYYYKMNLTDYKKVENSIKETHNCLVKELGLSKELLF